MKIFVGIATKGRALILAETLKVLENQMRSPDRILICPTCPDDLPQEYLRESALPVEVIESPTGSCAQRNAILRASAEADVILFMDDDFFLAPLFLSNCESLFQNYPDIAIATGEVVADGIGGPGLSPEQARKILMDVVETDRHSISVSYAGYGCNMAVRNAVVKKQAILFDENLPLYAWQEDVDFSRCVSRHGRVVKDASLAGVHLGHKSGRSPGLMLGYSQVANPIFLFQKGSVSFAFTLRIMTRNASKNIVRSLFPEPWIDRRGRLKGNILAIWHLLRGKLHPTTILDLNAS